MRPAVFPYAVRRAVQRGVSLVAAIFLLLLFAALAALMANQMSTANVTSAQDVQGSRAYLAAQAGVEWGVFSLDTGDAAAVLPACFADAALNQIPGFAVGVTCERFPAMPLAFTEGGRTLAVYRITATASVPGAALPPVAVERQVSATVAKCLDPNVGPRIFNC